ncbi:MAG: hypothetical protein JXA66_03170 [Oligoflexia bacterium]|nr:hypothetical protein [Oligoflexia bacterium]
MGQRVVVSGTELFSIAKITSVVGIKGAAKAVPFVLSPEEMTDLLTRFDSVFISGQGDFPKRVKVKSAAVKKNAIVMSFVEFTNIESIQEMVGKDLFIESDNYASFLEKTGNPLQYIGYLLKDKAMGEVGFVSDVIRNGQSLLVIVERDNEHLVPLVDEFINSIDTKNRHILMDLPEGILG